MQVEYIENFRKLLTTYSNKKFTHKHISRFVEEIKVFWLKRLEFVRFIIENKDSSDIIVTYYAASSINIKNSEHYYLKMIGSIHLMQDPIMLMEDLFSFDDKRLDYPELEKYFESVVSSMQVVTHEYSESLFYLPLNLLIPQDKKDIIFEYFTNLMSSLFQYKIEDVVDFSKNNWSYEDIENKLGSQRNQIIFNNDNDIHLPLKEKIDKFLEQQIGLKSFLQMKSPTEIFWFCFFSVIAKTLDTLITSTSVNGIPYLNSSITVHYSIVFLDLFKFDDEISNLIKTALIIYICRESIHEDDLNAISFSNFEKALQDNPILVSIENEMNLQGIDLFHSGSIDKIAQIIKQIFYKMNF